MSIVTHLNGLRLDGVGRGADAAGGHAGAEQRRHCVRRGTWAHHAFSIPRLSRAWVAFHPEGQSFAAVLSSADRSQPNLQTIARLGSVSGQAMAAGELPDQRVLQAIWSPLGTRLALLLAGVSPAVDAGGWLPPVWVLDTGFVHAKLCCSRIYAGRHYNVCVSILWVE